MSLEDTKFFSNPFDSSIGESSRRIKGPMGRFIINLEDGKKVAKRF